jgi:fatty acid desaturase
MAARTAVDRSMDAARISAFNVKSKILSREGRMSRTGALSLLLAFVPFLAMCFSVPLWDRVYPLVFGLPFNLFWLIAWIPLTSLCLWGVYRLRQRSANDGRRPLAPAPKGTSR